MKQERVYYHHLARDTPPCTENDIHNPKRGETEESSIAERFKKSIPYGDGLTPLRVERYVPFRADITAERHHQEISRGAESTRPVKRRTTRRKGPTTRLQSDQAELTDEELIIKTLQKFTTFKPDGDLVNPLVRRPDWESIAFPSTITQAEESIAGASEVAGQSSLSASPKKSGQAGSSIITATPGSEIPEKQALSQETTAGESQMPNKAGITSAKATSDVHGLVTGSVLEQPSAMTSEDISSKSTSKLHASKRQARFANDSTSTASIGETEHLPPSNLGTNPQNRSLGSKPKQEREGSSHVFTSDVSSKRENVSNR